MRSRLAILTLLLIPLLFMSPELGAQSEQGMLYAVESLGHADGTFSYRYLAYDRQTGRFSPAEPGEILQQAREPQTTHDRFQRLLVRQSSRWGRSTTQNFRVAEKAPPTSRLLTRNKALVRSVETLVHKRRGHLSIPRFKLGNGTRPVRDIRPRHPSTHARDPRLEYEQFDFDNFNVYARTEDNRFFFFDPPFVTSRAIRFEFASCSFGGGVFRCPFFIVECDIYFKAGTDLDLGFFEDLPISTQKESIAGHHKFCQGHDSNVWSHDLSGTMNRDVTQQTFNRNNGPVWPREREEDAALYGVAGAAALKPPPSGPFILPKRLSVLDAGWLKPPIYDVTRSAAANAFQYDAAVLTNLKGFSNGKDLRMWIYRGKSTAPRNLILGPLRGSSIRRRGAPLNGRPTLVRYYLSNLAIGRKADWDKLMLTVKRPGNMDKVVKGRNYDYAQEVTIVVKGFLTEKGPRKTAKNVYTIVYNEFEERDPEIPAVAFR